MKESNLNTVAEMAATILDANDYDLPAIIGRDNAIFCLVAIYTTNDVCKGYGQDFLIHDALKPELISRNVSVISFEQGVSVIVDSESSRYQDRFPMCGYESLYEDLYQIAICIQAAFDRIEG